jgi:hypothetical protein
MGLPRRALEEQRAARALGERYVDLAVEFTDGKRVARVGGRWDRKLRRYCGPPDAFVHRVVTEDQFTALTYVGDEPVRYVSGGIGSGKTTLGADVCLLFSLRYPEERAWWVAPVYRTCKVGLRKVLERFPSSWITGYTANEKSMRVTTVNGFVIDFRSAVHEEHLESDDCRLIVGDEGGRFAPGVRVQLRERITRNKGPGYIYYPCTPTDELEEEHAKDGVADERGHVEVKLFELSSLRNQFVDAANYEHLAGIVTEREFDRVVHGRLAKRPGRVFHGFTVKTHMRPAPDLGEVVTRQAVLQRWPHARQPIPDMVTAWAATVDRGRPMVTLVFRAFAAEDGTHVWWCVDEIVSTNVTVTEQVKRVREHLQRRYGYSGRGAYATVTADQRELDRSELDGALVAAGFRILGDQPGSSAAPEQASADAVNGLLAPADGGEPHLFVDPRCSHTKRVMQLLMWGAGGHIDRGQSFGTDLAHADVPLRGFCYRFNDPEYRRLYPKAAAR